MHSNRDHRLSHSFRAFLDESGDDGLDPNKYRVPGKAGGASTWMTICACMMRASVELESVGWRDTLVQQAGKKGRGRQIHFHELNHSQKRYVAQQIAKYPLRYAAALTNKKDDIRPGIYTEKNQLYFYMTRYVIERISWFCRDYRSRVKEGDGRVKITFSRRGGMSYEDFREYLLYLKNHCETQIYWPVIDIEGIDALDHSRSAALQLADCGARAITEAFEEDRFGNTEDAYLNALKPALYHRKGNYLSYGLKILPTWQNATLTESHIRAITQFR